MSQVQIPTTAKGAFFHKQGGPVAVEDYKVTQPQDLKPGEVLVKVRYSGVCHTDLHALLGDWPLDNKLPLCGGHEGAGEVVAIAEHTNTDLQVGDHVGLKWLADACMHCAYCRQGFESLCASSKLHGFTTDGSFQQYAVSYCNHLSKIPKELPLDEAAPILCAGVTVFKAIKQSQARVGQWICIPGAGGGLGHLAIQYAHVQGLRVIAVDTGADKKALCEKLGAEAWVDFKTSKDLVADIKAATSDGLGPQAAIVAAAGAAAYEQALDYIRPGGVVVAVGLPPGAVVKSDVFFHVAFEKKLIGSYVGNRQDATEALELAAAGKVKCIFETKPLNALPEIYDAMHKGQLTGRVVLDLFA